MNINDHCLAFCYGAIAKQIGVSVKHNPYENDKAAVEAHACWRAGHKYNTGGINLNNCREEVLQTISMIANRGARIATLINLAKFTKNVDSDFKLLLLQEASSVATSNAESKLIKLEIAKLTPA